MRPEQLKEMNEIDWWHNMQLDGVMTKGRDYTQEKLLSIQMPKDLTGKTVIDVGAWDGFFSFEAERRNAKEVLAIDTIMWKEHPTFNVQKNRETMHTGKKGFNFARKILKSKVLSDEIEVMDLRKQPFRFDLVLCLGILYHMEDPFGMCKVMYDITADDGMMILETHLDCEYENIMGKPMMMFYPNKECNNDIGTWWGPNVKCVEGMLKAAGFNEVKMILKNNNRGVFHAWKKKK